jgi:hypothetical protein
MRTGLKRGARLVFACWRELGQNPWLQLPLSEAYRHVPRLPEPAPEDPGAFSFASATRVRDILTRAGFGAIELEPVALSLDLATGRGLESAVGTAVGIGPAARALEGQPPALRSAATAAIRAALETHQEGERVALAGAIWIVTATNP